MLGSYYPPYYPTPGQPRVAPGVGSYYNPAIATGQYEISPAAVAINIAINAASGYLVGKHLGYPTASAIATGLFGLPGLFVTTLYASSQSSEAARPNPNADAGGMIRWLR